MAEDQVPAPGGAPPRPGRLRKRPEFLRAAAGSRVHGRCMTVQACKRPDEPGRLAEPRFGLTLTRKVGGAVERNRIKRRLRAAIRAPGLAAQPGHDYVLIGRRDALTAGFAELVAELSRGVARSATELKKVRGPRPGHGRTRPPPPKPASQS